MANCGLFTAAHRGLTNWGDSSSALWRSPGFTTQVKVCTRDPSPRASGCAIRDASPRVDRRAIVPFGILRRLGNLPAGSTPTEERKLPLPHLPAGLTCESVEVSLMVLLPREISPPPPQLLLIAALGERRWKHIAQPE